jgi:hypothetical protein
MRAAGERACACVSAAAWTRQLVSGEASAWSLCCASRTHPSHCTHMHACTHARARARASERHRQPSTCTTRTEDLPWAAVGHKAQALSCGLQLHQAAVDAPAIACTCTCACLCDRGSLGAWAMPAAGCVHTYAVAGTPGNAQPHVWCTAAHSTHCTGSAQDSIPPPGRRRPYT